VRPDGTRRWIVARGAPTFAADGKLAAFHGTVQDVTDRHRDEEAIRESEQHYRTLANASSVIIWATTPDKALAFCNESFQRFTGRSESELLGVGWLATIHPDDLHSLQAAYDQADATRDRFVFEGRMRNADGAYRWIRDEGTPRYDSKGVFLGYIGIAVDVTEMREARDRVTAMLGALPDLMFGVDLEGTINEFHSAAGNRLYLPPKDFLGKRVRDVLPALASSVIMEALEEAARTGSSRGRVYHLPEGDTDLWYELSVALMPKATHADPHFIVLVRDVTRRKAMEAELDAHRTRLEALVDERTAALRSTTERLERTQFAMDRVGIGIQWADAATGRLLYANEVMTRMLGYTRDELCKLSVGDIDPHFRNAELTRQVASLREQGYLHQEREARTKDGRTIPVELSAYYTKRAPPERDLVIAFVTDISARAAQEQALRVAKEAAVAASVAKSAFLANMSHEIRTPLNAITGMAYLLKRSQPATEQVGRLDKIIAASQHLLEIINAVLELSKIEAGKFDLAENAVDLGQILGNVAGMVSEQARAKGLTLTTEGPQPPPGLVGDATRVQQALLNYAVNAVKFTEAGSVRLRYRIEHQTPDFVDVRFAVEDTGIGIEPASLERLFTPFEQVDSSLTRKYGGTGLGLAITRRLAMLMGGDAGVDSTPNAGSTFWFTVRLQRSQAPAAIGTSESTASAEDELRRRCAGRRLLLVEDDPINAEVIVELVKLAGLVVVVADDGVEALDRARQSRYDLVLMDIQMPRMDGLAATRALRALAPYADVPILAISANVFAVDRGRALEAGMSDFIPKPVVPQELFAKLLRWLAPPAEPAVRP